MRIRSSLIDFETPPVTEVVCGITFKPFENMLSPHFGLLWEKYKNDYPKCREVAPLTPIIERFEDAPSPSPDFELRDTPPLPRIWFVHKNETAIIQVQRDRFLHNWRKMEEDDEYPRYDTVIEMFKDHFDTFKNFLREQEFGTLNPLQYEMTYINHIPQGEAWESMNDINKVFSDFSFDSNLKNFLPSPEVVNFRISFKMPENSGRLHAIIRNGKFRNTGKPMLLLELTARGISLDKSTESMWGWFDMAREWIAYGFADLTNKEAQKRIWKRKD
jgi:uncharacterized protein (TIGR04255 family)